MRKTVIANKILFAVLTACFVVCVILLIPSVRFFIVDVTEKILIQRVLDDHNRWVQLLLRLSVAGIAVSGITALVCLFVDYPRYITMIKNNIVSIDYKKFLMPIVCMFGLYVLGIMSIIRANFLYIDDMGRAIIGNRGWGHFSRYITEWNPVIKRLVPLNLGTDWDWGNVYLTGHYRFNLQQDASIEDTGLETMFDSYYHTIKSDGKRVLVILK